VETPVPTILIKAVMFSGPDESWQGGWASAGQKPHTGGQAAPRAHQKGQCVARQVLAVALDSPDPGADGEIGKGDTTPGGSWKGGQGKLLARPVQTEGSGKSPSLGHLGTQP
jgi:hypothetical protein